MEWDQQVVGMVHTLERHTKTFYVCEECGLIYKEREWAEKCEEFCAKYQMCSLEITRYAVQLDTTNGQ